jgi:hypothetical protein
VASSPDIAREVVINDSGHHIRQLLTKRQTLDEISKRTNTQVSWFLYIRVWVFGGGLECWVERS